MRLKEREFGRYFVSAALQSLSDVAGERQGLWDRWPPSPSQAGEIAPSQPPEWMASQPVSLK